MILNFLYIALFWVIVIDVFNFYDEFLGMILKFVFRNDKRGDNIKIPQIKPFSCSKCLTFWSIIVFLIIAQNINIKMIFLAALFSLLTEYMLLIYNTAKIIIIKILKYVK